MIVNRPDIKAISAAFSLNVDIIACHTCLDSARGGINDCLASLAGLKNVCPLEPSADARGFGMGACGEVESSECETLCDSVASVWQLSGYRLIGKSGKVDKVALCGGAGGDLWKKGHSLGAQLYISADLRYNECADAVDAGMSVMVCDHGEMENRPLEPFAENIRRSTGERVYFFDLVTAKRGNETWRSLINNVSN